MLLVLQAPSFRLEQYIQQQHNPAAAATDAASQLHTAVSTLRASLAAQRELLASMSAACEQYQEAVLSQTLQDTALTAPTPSELPGAADQQDAADTAAAAGHGPSGEAAAAHEVWQPEELALLMDALTAGLQQDLEWMVRGPWGVGGSLVRASCCCLYIAAPLLSAGAAGCTPVSSADVSTHWQCMAAASSAFHA